MSKYQMGDQITFENGEVYLMITSFVMNGQEYTVLGRDAEDSDDAFIFGIESVDAAGNASIEAVQDVSKLAEIQKFLQANPSILG